MRVASPALVGGNDTDVRSVESGMSGAVTLSGNQTEAVAGAGGSRADPPQQTAKPWQATRAPRETTKVKRLWDYTADDGELSSETGCQWCGRVTLFLEGGLCPMCRIAKLEAESNLPRGTLQSAADLLVEEVEARRDEAADAQLELAATHRERVA